MPPCDGRVHREDILIEQSAEAAAEVIAELGYSARSERLGTQAQLYGLMITDPPPVGFTLETELFSGILRGRRPSVSC